MAYADPSQVWKPLLAPHLQGLRRVRARHIDVPGNVAFDPERAEAEGFFMDMMLEEELLPLDARYGPKAEA